ncbi:DUF2138 family protein [Escherichia coli]
MCKSIATELDLSLQRLSQPASQDLLTIPFLHHVLSEDFVFYYQNHADCLASKAALSYCYEHDRTPKISSFVTLRSARAGSAAAR